MVDIFRIDPDVSAVLSDMLFVLVPTEWFAHVESVLTFFRCCGIITIVVDHPSVYSVPVRQS